jgi:beta-phosphoglucomutase-like phosphatase (HAD superfamily)
MSSLLPKYVLFDMDGTLIDNYEFHVKAWGQMCSKYGVPRNRSEIIRDLHGTNFEICQKYFGPEITFEQSEFMSQEKEVLYRELYAPHITPIPGLVPDPEIFMSCLQGLGATEELRKEELWVFEDTTSGIQAAVRTGGTAFGILTSCDEKTLLNHGATRVFADYQKVMNLLL